MRIPALLVAACAAGCLPGQLESRPAGPWVAAVGNANNLNVVAGVPARGAAVFRYWQRDAQGLVREGGVGQGEVAAAAAWREHLLVFFPSGRYGLFGPGRPDVQPSPVPAWTPVAACEDGLSADAFGWDASGELIHARFQDGAWTWRRVEGRPERERVLEPCAVRFGGRLFFVWREEASALTGTAREHRLRFLYLDKGRWTGPTVSRLAAVAGPRVAATGDVLACLVQKPAGESPPAWVLAAYAASDEDWHEVGPVDGLPPAAPAGVALARQSGGFFVVIYRGAGPEIAPLQMPSGPRERPRVGEFAPLGPRESRPQGGGTSVAWLMGVAAVVVLAAIMAARRRAELQPAAGAPPVQAGPPAPASVARRAAAAALDYLLVSMAMAPLMEAYWPDLLDRILTGDASAWSDVTVVHFIGTGAVVAYMAAAEGLFARTVGKQLLGMEVRSADGGPVRWWQAAVRNVFRVVDELPALYLAGVVSMVIGPRPQRIGDRVAGTMVVMRFRGSGRSG